MATSSAPGIDRVAETDPAGPGPSRSRFPALQSPNFRTLWIALVVTNTGTWMATVGEGWLVTDLEPQRKSFYLGLIALAFAVPMAVLPLVGGVLADRVPKIRLLWITQITFLLQSIVVATLTLTGRATVGMLIAASFVTAVILAVDSPVRHSLVPDIVDRDQLTSAISLNSAAFQGAQLIGPAVAGALIPTIGVGGVFAVNAISSLATLAALRRFRPFVESRRDRSGDRVAAAVAAAFRYVRGTPLVGGLLLLSLSSGLFGRSYSPLMPAFARDVYGVGSTGYGFLVTAGGIGAIAGAAVLAGRRDELRNRGRIAIAAYAVQILLLALLAATDRYAVGVAVQVVFAISAATAAALVSTLIQSNVPPQIRARVVSFMLLTFIAAPSVGTFALGSLADATSLRTAVGVFAGCLAVALAVVVARNPVVRTAS